MPSATRWRTRRPAVSARVCASSGSTTGTATAPRSLPTPEVTETLAAKGLIQEQAPLPGRFEEIDAIAERFGRDPGVVSWPAREIERLMRDDDWDFGPAIRARAKELVDRGGLPDYPEEMRATFEKIMQEHGLDTGKYLS